MFRHPDTSGSTPRLSKTRAKALKRRDRFPRLPLTITLRETFVAMRLHWRELLALSWLTLLVYTGLTFAFLWLEQVLISPTAGLSVGLGQSTGLLFLRGVLLEFLLLGFYGLAVYRLMLLGEPAAAPRYTDVWIQRFLTFLAATMRAMLLPLLALTPYVVFIGLQMYWFSLPELPSYVPTFLVASGQPTRALLLICVVLFYFLFARFAFVQPAVAVDVPYSPRESWRVTNWVWGHMLVITLMTLGLAAALIFGLGLLWPAPAGMLSLVSTIIPLFLACLIWIIGITGFIVALSIAFCLRTGWRPGAQKLSLNRKPKRMLGA